MSVADRARQAIHSALHKLAESGALGENGAGAVATATGWSVERPKRPEHGDFATNAAMILTKKVGKAPREIAEMLVGALAASDIVKSAEIAGPGFVNLRVHARAFHAELSEILETGKGYGHLRSSTAERVNVEFVSANPTGPLLVAHGRGAIYGDAVARLLEATGNLVTREYYINDFGNQVRLFAESVLASSEGRDVPEDGYKGAYIDELARWLKKVDPEVLSNAQSPDGRATLSRTCVTWMLNGIPGSKDLPGIKTTLKNLRVLHDVWYSEESLHRWGQVPVALRKLQDGGFLVERDGALFFKSTEVGGAKKAEKPGKDGSKNAEKADAPAKPSDDKDRVVRKSDGAYTYFASDIAYHADKVNRGYDRLVNVLGADHHGYVARVRNALEALGLPSEKFEALLFQLVFIYRDGQLVKSSKRAGNIITVEEVAEEIDDAAGREGAGADALRFFFLSRSANSNVEFDIELAKKKSLDNPVFYVQYGCARLSSILRKASEVGIGVPRDLDLDEWSHLAHPDELAIAARLAEYPQTLVEAAQKREPHRIVFYLQELATQFQSYFTRLKTDPILPPASVRAQAGWEKSWDFKKTAARLAWIAAIRTVYAGALDLLGITVLERMDKPAASSAEGASEHQADDEADDEGTGPGA